jgi:poly(glycerol-phosphate) alpha-glucosyltransferase
LVVLRLQLLPFSLKTIFQITSWLTAMGGGIPPVIESLAREFSRRKIPWQVAGLAEAAESPTILAGKDELTIGLVSGPRAIGFSAALSDTLLARVTGESIIHVHGLWMYPGLLARKLSENSGAKLIVSPHGMLDPWALQNSRWKKRLAAWLFEDRNLRNASCIHALCQSEAQSIRSYGLKSPIAVIPNGIDLPETGELAYESRTAPWQNFVPPGTKVLLFLSRIHPKKGLSNLLRAWKSIQKAEDGRGVANGWALAIAGWDQSGHEDELKQLATELGLSWADLRKDGAQKPESARPTKGRIPGANLLFLGPQFNGDKAACYRACNGFILPSFSEGLPMVILEAWAHGRPTLMTPECNLQEGFDAGAAIRIDTSPEGIAHGLAQFFALSEDARAEMGARGLDLARKSFSWPRVADQMLAVYEWMLGKAPAPEWVRFD